MQKNIGIEITSSATANRLCLAEDIEEKRELRQDAVAAQIKVWRSQLKTLLKEFSRIF